MQIRGKILTIAGIVLIFGYFISESFKSPFDSTQVIMVGNDTLGRDWGALNDLKDRENLQTEAPSTGENQLGTIDDSKEVKNISSEDPLTRNKFNQENYSTIESPDGREIITGYNRPEEQENDDESENDDTYKTRHQRERNQIEEPSIIYKE